MLDGVINSSVAGVIWLASAGITGNWFRRRMKARSDLLHADEEPKPTPEEATDIRVRLVLDAFACSGVWLAMFVLFDVLF